MDSDALDRYITGGRYSSAVGEVHCPDCEETTTVCAETEYGATTWDKDVCGTCGREFTGDEQWDDAEPPEPDYDDDPAWD